MKKISKILFFFLILLFSSSLFAQAPHFQWSALYGGAEDDYAFDIEVLADGYLIAGHTKSFGNANGKYDIWLVRTDEMGNILWTKTYGGSLDESVLSVSQAHDGGFILCGHTSSWGQGLSDGYFVRIDRHGDTLWTRHYGGMTSDAMAWGIPTRDQGFIFTGHSSVYLMGDQMYIVKTNGYGDTLWTQREGGDNQDYGKCIIQTSDNAYASVGHTWSQGNEAMGFLVRMNQSGHVTWWNAFGDTGEDYAKWFDQNADNSFTICGTTASYGHGSNDFWLVFTNPDGLPVNWYTYGGSSSDVLNGAGRDADGGILLAGDTWSFGVEAPDVFFMKTDAEGDSLWAVTWGDEDWQYAYDIKPTFDGGYVVIGRHYSITTGDNNILLLKYGPHPTIYNTLQYHHVDLPIEDNQSTLDTMTLFIPETSTIVGGMVYIDTVLHGETRDLVFTLTHDGITDTLIDRPEAGGANIYNAALHNAASCEVQAGIAPFRGIYRPYRMPAVFRGTKGGGPWELRIHDTQTGNEGTLKAWGLRVYYETMVGIGEKVADREDILEAFPNPCTGMLRIKYILKDEGHCDLGIYDLQGRKLVELYSGYSRQPEQSFSIDLDENGLRPGMYIIRLASEQGVTCRKLIFE